MLSRWFLLFFQLKSAGTEMKTRSPSKPSRFPFQRLVCSDDVHITLAHFTMQDVPPHTYLAAPCPSPIPKIAFLQIKHTHGSPPTKPAIWPPYPITPKIMSQNHKSSLCNPTSKTTNIFSCFLPVISVIFAAVLRLIRPHSYPRITNTKLVRELASA